MTKSFELDYAKYYDFFNQEKNYAHEVDFLQKAFRKYETSPTKSVLNLGCGTGMHEIHLAKQGYTTSGVDLSPEMVKIAHARDLPHAEFHIGDMSKFNLGKKFDACTVMFAAFGYLTENEQIASSLACIKNHLLPGGLVIIEVWNGSGVLTIKPSSRIKEFVRDGIEVRRQSFPTVRAFEQRVDVHFKINLAREGNEFESYEELHKMRYFFPQEMKYYFEMAGFELLEACKAFELGAAVDENEWNIVFIGRAR